MAETQVLAHRFGDVAKSMGLVTDDQINEAMRRQSMMKISGGKGRLGEVLIAMNVLNVEQVKKVLSEQRKLRAAEAAKALPMEYFGEYKLIERLGEGGMGTVFKAQETLANRTVALKVLRKNFAGNSNFVERFSREAKLAGSLAHPNIVACHNAGTNRGVQFLVMEFIEGPTLKVKLKEAPEGRLPEKEALTIIRDVAKGLAHAHDKGIIHRDIKPDNILLGKDGVKISDFGTAKSFLDEESITQTGVVIGTPHYISPEQVKASKDIDHRADLYALGGTLYHALTGKVPFEAPTALEIMRKHLQEDLENPADLNPALSAGAVEIVTKLMAKAQAERYQSANDLVADIDRVITGQAPTKANLEVNKSSIRPPRIRKAHAKKNSAGCMGMLMAVFAVAIAIIALK